MDTTIGDQQVTSHQLAWLSGIWDGEGSFQINSHIIKNGEYYNARLTLTNSSVEMIAEIVSILDNCGVKAHLFKEQMRKKKHRQCYHLTVNKISSVKKTTELMLPYLIAKKAHAKLLLRFVGLREKYRQSIIQDPATGRVIGIKKQGYSSEEKSLCEQLHQLNGGLERKGIKEGTSETTRRTP